MQAEANILHADLDSFYASVEQRDDPRLLGRPVIVGSGVVLAASYEAKAFGVRTPMGGAQARRLCPSAIVVEPRMEAYSEASRAVFEVFNDTTPMVEGISIDEAFLDVSGLRRIAGPPVEIAAALRVAVRQRVGLPITVGVARTKFLAKVASRVAKPDGLLVVPPDREVEFLHPLPVEMLWGVGPVTAGKLHDAGIWIVEEVGAPLRAVAGVETWSRIRTSAFFPLAQSRSAAGPGWSATPFDRLAKGDGAVAQIVGGHRLGFDWARRPGHPPNEESRTSRTDGDCAIAIRRLHSINAIIHCARSHRPHGDNP